MEPDRRTTSIPKAAIRLGIGRNLAYRLAREGRFPCRVLRAGRRYLVVEADLQRVLGAGS